MITQMPRLLRLHQPDVLITYPPSPPNPLSALRSTCASNRMYRASRPTSSGLPGTEFGWDGFSARTPGTCSA
jgi:hypothetical protein